MKNKETINDFYNAIADELNIPDSVFEKAENSYKALGSFLENNLSQYKIKIFPQGSMNLGTLIKPISDEDDYDLDAVCEVYYNFSEPSDLKNLIGNALKSSDRYKKLLDKEGKRCWTLKYSDDSHFHMDILPSSPNSLADKSLKITHKENYTYKYMISNPEAYSDWFDKIQEKERRILFEQRNIQFSNKVEDLRKYNIRTTLQKTIQILKRHRDIKYKDASDEERENKPISIIITTLVGLIYTGEESILDLIIKFTTNFENYIEIDGDGNYIIKNPVNNKENFADKWNLYPKRKEAFYTWMKELKHDLITNNFMIFDDLPEKANYLKTIFGNEVINSVFEKRNDKLTNKYIKHDEIATLTSNTTDIKIKPHTFYGK